MPLASILARPQFTAAEHDAELELPYARRLSYAAVRRGATARSSSSSTGPARAAWRARPPPWRGGARPAARRARPCRIRTQHADRRRPRRRLAAPITPRCWMRSAPGSAGIVSPRPVRAHAVRARRCGGSCGAARHDRRRARRRRWAHSPNGPCAPRAGTQVRRAAMLGRRAPWLLRLALRRRRAPGGQGPGEGRREDRRRPPAARRRDHRATRRTGRSTSDRPP